MKIKVSLVLVFLTFCISCSTLIISKQYSNKDISISLFENNKYVLQIKKGFYYEPYSIGDVLLREDEITLINNRKFFVAETIECYEKVSDSSIVFLYDSLGRRIIRQNLRIFINDTILYTGGPAKHFIKKITIEDHFAGVIVNYKTKLDSVSSVDIVCNINYDNINSYGTDYIYFDTLRIDKYGVINFNDLVIIENWIKKPIEDTLITELKNIKVKKPYYTFLSKNQQKFLKRKR